LPVRSRGGRPVVPTLRSEPPGYPAARVSGAEHAAMRVRAGRTVAAAGLHPARHRAIRCDPGRTGCAETVQGACSRTRDRTGHRGHLRASQGLEVGQEPGRQHHGHGGGVPVLDPGAVVLNRGVTAGADLCFACGFRAKSSNGITFSYRYRRLFVENALKRQPRLPCTPSCPAGADANILAAVMSGSAVRDRPVAAIQAVSRCGRTVGPARCRRFPGPCGA